MKKRNYIIYPLLVLAMALLTGCKRKVGPTHVVVSDPVRHYNAINLGDELEIYYNITNVGKFPLVITDIQPSCGCISAKKHRRLVIFPGKTSTLQFTFIAHKNVGYVHHFIRLYGNISPLGVLPLEFEVNVVSPSSGTPDYEEYFSRLQREANILGFSVKDAVDGDLTEQDT